MFIMYKNLKQIVLKGSLALTVILGVSSCETTTLEILDNPNALTPGQSDINLFLNSIELTTNSFFQNVTDEGMQVSRTLVMAGPTYTNAYAPSNFDGAWSNAYAGIFADVNAMIPVAEEQGFYIHVGIAQILKAYVAITLVDYFGDVPFTEAGTGEFLNPNTESGASVYAAANQLLTDGIANLAKGGPAPTTDLYYAGNLTRWKKFANTLKIKMLLNTRLVDNTAASKINTIVSSGDFINAAADDFIFRYATTNANPDSRHPQFINNFDQAADVNTYMSNSFMDHLIRGKVITDPRLRYYFYRQSLTITTNPQDLPCITETRPAHWPNDIVFCNAQNGYWGRDHGDNDGIPPDGGLRTAFGLYPIGGRFDANQGLSSNGRAMGTTGSGISPIMLSSYVQFMLAENALNGGAGNARTFLEAGVRQSISKVMTFRDDLVTQSFKPSTGDVDDYVANVLSLYDAAGTNDAKLEVVAREYWIAAFGNGVETYNLVRRTGKPANLQPTLNATPGSFIRSFLYPNTFVSNNQNVSQKPGTGVETPVFWDTNPAGLVK